MIAALALALLVAASPAPVRISVVGDSLALGVGASDSANGFAFLLYKRVLGQRPGSRVTNLAISGATVGDALRLEVPRLAGSAPDIVLVCVGGNDVIRFHTREAFARDYGALVDAVRKAAPHARILLFNVPDVSVSPIFDPRAARIYEVLALDDNAAVRANALRAGAAVIDLYAITAKRRNDTSRFLSSDQFHPSDQGHAAIADQAWPSVARLLDP